MISAAAFCLALNVYWEARSEDVISQASVAWVALNRVRNPRYPSNACAVITEAKLWKGHPIRDQCQFSWYCDGLSDFPKNKDAFSWAVHIAKLVIDGAISDPTEGSTHYHADYVNPKWKKLKKTVTIGIHHFYKEH